MFTNMKLGVKLGLGFGLVILLSIISTMVGYFGLRMGSEDLDRITNDRFPKTVIAQKITDAVNVNARSIRNALLLKNPQEVQKELARIPDQHKIIGERLDKLEATIKSEKGMALLKAAQEIGDLAGSTVELAEKAGRLLAEIVHNIRKTSDLVQEITAASGEQSSGVGQINSAVGQLSQTTQQNASSSKQLAATSEDMSSQAEQLQQTMSFFKL